MVDLAEEGAAAAAVVTAAAVAAAPPAPDQLLPSVLALLLALVQAAEHLRVLRQMTRPTVAQAAGLPWARANYAAAAPLRLADASWQEPLSLSDGAQYSWQTVLSAVTTTTTMQHPQSPPQTRA